MLVLVLVLLRQRRRGHAQRQSSRHRRDVPHITKLRPGCAPGRWSTLILRPTSAERERRRSYWQTHDGDWPSPSVRWHRHEWLTPSEDENAHVCPIVGHDQKPSETSTAGHVPSALGPWGIACPSGVCAAAM